MNAKLWDRLKALQDPAPSQVFRSFGFSIDEKWREDGFVVGFEVAQLEAARAQIVGVAKDFGQGAIFEYQASAAGERGLTRITVPALVAGNSDEVTMVRITSPAAGNPMIDRPWAGPSG